MGRWPKKQINKAVELYRNGWAPKEIAGIMNVQWQTVYKVVRRAERERQPVSLRDEDRKAEDFYRDEERVVLVLMHRFVRKYFDMLRRCRSRGIGKDTELNPTVNGFLRWLRMMGPVPVEMERPSLGRHDQKLGYVKGNFGWREWTRKQK